MPGMDIAWRSSLTGSKDVMTHVDIGDKRGRVDDRRLWIEVLRMVGKKTGRWARDVWKGITSILGHPSVCLGTIGDMNSIFSFSC